MSSGRGGKQRRDVCWQPDAHSRVGHPYLLRTVNMNASFPPPACGDHDEHEQEYEQVEVMRIRLRNPASATALLGEFQSADRVLARWGSLMDGSPVDFEVTFHDGYVVRGSHAFFRKGKRRCLLATHVRRMLERAVRQADAGFPVPKPDLARYALPL